MTTTAPPPTTSGSPSVRTTGLGRTFGDLRAVDDLTVALPRGGVVGLVGPNGSGKSTLIRMLLGLIRPSSGEAQVLGAPIDDPTAYAGRVGALLEAPAFSPALSARANLVSLARLRGLPLERVTQVLGEVGLLGRESEPVKRYSLGMKQRLGIAAALLPDPDLLLLDEPTNGLDPAGVVEVRALLQRLGSQGRTVVVSSHLLTEIEAVCTHLVVVRFGVLLFSGPIGDLLTRAVTRIDLLAEHDADGDRLLEVARTLQLPATRLDDGGVQVTAPADAAAALNRAAAQAGITLRSLVVRRESLEAVFLAMTGDDAELSASRAAAQQSPAATRGARP
ncbi:ATP-binding cassette domain-containing protein [Quadrisphaera sp. KR29]|uniref:ATP-binding cassette domain-containing protein n=1 Tax=Quadrisphaera sp. KR29 TaxID=3461391 RepID=UPI0040446C4A